jgi:hypothetical protein
MVEDKLGTLLLFSISFTAAVAMAISGMTAGLRRTVERWDNFNKCRRRRRRRRMDRKLALGYTHLGITTWVTDGCCVG